MRVIGGKYRGLKLQTPSSDHIRPTTDRMRESLFNMLEHGTGPGIRGANVLDLFAGTGALGVEAISRGASHVTFIDKTPKSLKIAQQNFSSLKNEENAEFFQADGTKINSELGDFDIVFIDPPYRKGLITPSLENLYEQKLLNKNSVVIIEFSSGETIELPEYFKELKRKKMGDSTFVILLPTF